MPSEAAAETNTAVFSQPRAGQSREIEKFRLYNRSRDSFLNLEVAVFDATAEPLKRLFEYLLTKSNSGLWLKPYRGIPATQGARIFDLVYLDDECRVAERSDKYPNPRFAILEGNFASALLLPAHSAFAFQIHTGDQLTICKTAELKGMLTALSHTTDGDSSTHAADVEDHSSLNSAPFRIPLASSIEQLKGKRPFGERVRRWFTYKPLRQRSLRHPLPGLIAYHWSGGTPQPYALGDISGTGLYLLTEERPYVGTLFMMTLQRINANGERLHDSVAVNTKVIRWGTDGVGFALMVPKVNDAQKTDHHPGGLADQATLNLFVKRALATRASCNS